MNITLPTLLTHHALKLLPPTILAMTLLQLSPSNHWAHITATALLAVLLFAQLLLGALHAYASQPPCPRCTPKPSDRLGRIHYRTFAAIGRNGGPPLLALIAIITMVVWPATSTPSADSGFDFAESLSTTELATRAAIYLAIAGFLSATRFYRLNHPAGGLVLGARILNRCKRLVHRGHWLVLGTITILIALTFTSRDDTPWLVIRGLFLVIYLAVFLLYMRHGRTLCEECAIEFRTDAPEYAETKRWRFTVLHRYSPYLGLLSITLVWVSVFMDGILRNTLMSVSYVFTGAIVFVTYFHSAYQLWCPYCRGGGGGGGDQELTPEPTRGHGRPLPVS